MADHKGPPSGKPPAKPTGKPPPKGGGSGDNAPLAEIGIFLLILLLVVPVVATYIYGPTNDGIFGTVLRIHGFIKSAATVVSMLALVVIIYSFTRILEISAEESKKLGVALNWSSEKSQKNARWERVENYMSSLNSSDWKIGILEADNILDDIIERMGYKGDTLGERLKNIEASDFPYLDEAWAAHKLRNQIAHRGTDYDITRSEAEQTINIYHRIFKELGYL